MAKYLIVPAGIELDTSDKSLRRGAELLTCAPIVMELLLYLVEQLDRIVTREELHQSVWKHTVVEESAITQAVFALRLLIADANREYLKTIPRRGYFLSASAIKKIEADAAVKLPKPELEHANQQLLASPEQTKTALATANEALLINELLTQSQDLVTKENNLVSLPAAQPSVHVVSSIKFVFLALILVLLVGLGYFLYSKSNSHTKNIILVRSAIASVERSAAMDANDLFSAWLIQIAKDNLRKQFPHALFVADRRDAVNELTEVQVSVAADQLQLQWDDQQQQIALALHAEPVRITLKTLDQAWLPQLQDAIAQQPQSVSTAAYLAYALHQYGVGDQAAWIAGIARRFNTQDAMAKCLADFVFASDTSAANFAIANYQNACKLAKVRAAERAGDLPRLQVWMTEDASFPQNLPLTLLELEAEARAASYERLSSKTLERFDAIVRTALELGDVETAARALEEQAAVHRRIFRMDDETLLKLYKQARELFVKAKDENGVVRIGFRELLLATELKPEDRAWLNSLSKTILPPYESSLIVLAMVHRGMITWSVAEQRLNGQIKDIRLPIKQFEINELAYKIAITQGEVQIAERFVGAYRQAPMLFPSLYARALGYDLMFHYNQADFLRAAQLSKQLSDVPGAVSDGMAQVWCSAGFNALELNDQDDAQRWFTNCEQSATKFEGACYRQTGQLGARIAARGNTWIHLPQDVLQFSDTDPLHPECADFEYLRLNQLIRSDSSESLWQRPLSAMAKNSENALLFGAACLRTTSKAHKFCDLSQLRSAANDQQLWPSDQASALAFALVLQQQACAPGDLAHAAELQRKLIKNSRAERQLALAVQHCEGATVPIYELLSSM